jgi:hypothetical protein
MLMFRLFACHQIDVIGSDSKFYASAQRIFFSFASSNAYLLQFYYPRNAKVNCLYFVAKGTLDDILWKLLEKKFRDLGTLYSDQAKYILQMYF